MKPNFSTSMFALWTVQILFIHSVLLITISVEAKPFAKHHNESHDPRNKNEISFLANYDDVPDSSEESSDEIKNYDLKPKSKSAESDAQSDSEEAQNDPNFPKVTIVVNIEDESKTKSVKNTKLEIKSQEQSQNEVEAQLLEKEDQILTKLTEIQEYFSQFKSSDRSFISAPKHGCIDGLKLVGNKCLRVTCRPSNTRDSTSNPHRHNHGHDHKKQPKQNLPCNQ